MGSWPDMNAMTAGVETMITMFGFDQVGVDMRASYSQACTIDETETNSLMQLYPVTVQNWTYITRVVWNAGLSGTNSNSAIGIYDENGNLRATTGPTSFAVATSVVLVTPVWIEPGAYYIASWGSNAGGAGFAGQAATMTPTIRRIFGVREYGAIIFGGALPSTITFQIPTLTAPVHFIGIQGKAVT